MSRKPKISRYTWHKHNETSQKFILNHAVDYKESTVSSSLVYDKTILEEKSLTKVYDCTYNGLCYWLWYEIYNQTNRPSSINGFFVHGDNE